MFNFVIRLLLRRGDSIEGKIHFETVPVKLLCPENSLGKKNKDRMLAKSFIDDIFEPFISLEPYTILFMLIDDKTHVKLGLTAATLQAPILMHLDYKVWLPDHSFDVG